MKKGQPDLKEDRQFEEDDSIELNILKAISEGNIDEVRKYIESGGDVNLVIQSKPLICHALLSKVGETNDIVIQILLSAGADLFKKFRSPEIFQTPFHIAIEQHTHFGLCISYLKSAEKLHLIDAQNGRGETALTIATKRGDVSNLHLLLECGADPTIRGFDGLSSVDVICTEAELFEEIPAITKYVKRFTKNTNEEASDFPLYLMPAKNDVQALWLKNKATYLEARLALFSTNTEKFNDVLKRGFDVDQAYKMQTLLSSVFQYKERTGKLHEIIHILYKSGANLFFRLIASGETLSHIFSENIGRLTFLLDLIKKDSRLVSSCINVIDYEGNSPLHRACKAKQWQCIELLLKNNAEAGIPNCKGEYPVDFIEKDVPKKYKKTYATLKLKKKNSEKGFTKRSLIRREYSLPSTELSDIKKLFFMMSETEDVRKKVLKCYKFYTAFLNTEIDGMLPLMHAIVWCNQYIALGLLKEGANPMLKSRKYPNDTPLHYAASVYVPLVLIQILLHLSHENSLDQCINTKNSRGMTPLHYAGMVGDPQAFKLIKDHGGDMTIQDESGRIPLEYLLENVSEEDLKLYEIIDGPKGDELSRATNVLKLSLRLFAQAKKKETNDISQPISKPSSHKERIKYSSSTEYIDAAHRTSLSIIEQFKAALTTIKTFKLPPDGMALISSEFVNVYYKDNTLLNETLILLTQYIEQLDLNKKTYEDYKKTLNYFRRVIENLLDNGANPCLRSLKPPHNTALHYAFWNPMVMAGGDYSWICKYLLDAACEFANFGGVNVKNGNGQTILHLVAQYDSKGTMTKSLALQGCFTEIKDSKGLSPVDILESCENFKKIKKIATKRKRTKVLVKLKSQPVCEVMSIDLSCDKADEVISILTSRQEAKQSKITSVEQLLSHPVPSISLLSYAVLFHDSLLVSLLLNNQFCNLTLSSQDSEKHEKNTAIHYAAIIFNLDILRLILEFLKKNKEIDQVNSKNTKGMTPMHYAGMVGDHQAFKIIKDYGGDITVQDELEKTPLDYLLENVSEEDLILYKIIDGPLDKKSQEKEDKTPKVQVVKERKNNLPQSTSQASSPIQKTKWLSPSRNSEVALRAMREKSPHLRRHSDVGRKMSSVDESLLSASNESDELSEDKLADINLLKRAFRKGDVDYVKRYIEAGEDVNALIDGQPLICYVLSSSVEKKCLEDIVKLLLASGADPTLENKMKSSAIDVASDTGHEEIAELLLNHVHQMKDKASKSNKRLSKSNQKFEWETALSKLKKGKDAFEQYLQSTNASVNSFDGRLTILQRSVRFPSFTVKILVECGADILMPSRTGFKENALHIAIKAKKPENLEILLSALKKQGKLKQGLESREAGGHTPLHYAALFDNTPCVELLLEFGADPTLIAGQGFSCIDMAKNEGHMHIADLLQDHAHEMKDKASKFNKQLSKSNQKFEWETAFSKLKKGKDAFEQYLQSTGGVNSFDGRLTILQRSVYFQSFIVKILVECGADILMPSKTNFKENALHRAIRAKKPENLEILLSALKKQGKLRQGLESREVCGYTPLHFAVFCYNTPCVELLLKFGADPTLIDNQGFSCIDMAIKEKYLHFAELLKAKDFNIKKLPFECGIAAEMLFKGKDAFELYLLTTTGGINFLDEELGVTLLQGHVKENNSADSTKVLLEFGADSLLPSKGGEYLGNSLHLAARAKHDEALETLLSDLKEHDKLKEGLESRDDIGDTPLHCAALVGSKEAAVVLLKFGADPTLVNKAKSSAIDVARDAGHEEIAELLKNHVHQIKDDSSKINRKLGVATPPSYQAPLPPKKKKESQRSGSLGGNLQVKGKNGSGLRRHSDLGGGLAKYKKIPVPRPPHSSNNTPQMGRRSPKRVERTTGILEKISIPKEMIVEAETTTLDRQVAEPITLIEQAMQDNTVEQWEFEKERSISLKVNGKTEKAKTDEGLSLVRQKIEKNKLEVAELREKLKQCDEKHNADMEELKEMVSDIQKKITSLESNQNYLMAVQAVKKQRNKMRKKFQKDPNLWEFYRTTNIKLEELFIGCKAVASGIVDHNLVEMMGKIGGGIKLLGKIAKLIPALGETVEGIAEGVGGAIEKIDHKRLENMLHVLSLLGTLGDVKKICERVARRLTKRYELQLKKMRTLDEELDALMQQRVSGNLKDKIVSNLKFMVQKGNKKLLKGKIKSPIEELAEYTVMKLFESMKEDEFKPNDDLEEQFLKAICYPPEDRPKSEKALRKLTKTFGIYTVITRTEETWYLGDIFQRVSIQTPKGRFVGGKINEKLYGFCISDIDGEVEERKLTAKILFRDSVLLKKSQSTPHSPATGKFISQTGKDLDEQRSKSELNKRQLDNERARRMSLARHVGDVKDELQSEREKRKELEERLALLEKMYKDRRGGTDEDEEDSEGNGLKSAQLL